jgi:predicted RNase H-like nuclease
MSSERTGSQTFTVTHSAPLDEEAVAAGVIAIDGDQHVQVISAEAEFAELLDLAADMVNSSDDFLVHADSPDETSRAIHKRVVPRDADNAREALLTVLREKYGFELIPAD